MTITTERFEYQNSDENSHKFWTYTYDSNTRQAIYRWGRIGTNGQAKTVDWVPPSMIDKKVEEKLAKGYTRVLPRGADPFKKPPDGHDPALSLVTRMEELAESADTSITRYTLVQSHEYVSWGYKQYEHTVEIAPIPAGGYTGKNTLELIEAVDGVADCWEEAYRLMELLNGVPVESGKPGKYPGEFSTITVDGAGVAVG